MTNNAVLLPMCVYTFFLLGLVIWLGYVRVSSARNRTMSYAWLRAGMGDPPADWIVDLHRHFSNQFEMPLLFYFGCTLAMLTGSATQTTVALAWTFVGLRFLHTAIVLINNRPEIRVGPYVLSVVVIGFIWGDLLALALR